MASTLVVGTDTYISAADATAYIAKYYPTTDAKYVAWAALTETNKDIVLRRAARTIDNLRLVGIKAISTQTLQFPRSLPTSVNDEYNGTITLNWYDGYYTQTEVPASVKYAQVEIALQLSVGEPKRIELQRQGVKSISIGKLSETYGGGRYAVISHEARELLAPYIAGSVPIC